VKIATFYSFKGGVGRSMGALNMAWALTEMGRRVVLIDADLHAPGLTMSKHFDFEKKKLKYGGIFEYIKAYLDRDVKPKPPIKNYANFVMEGDQGAVLHFIPVADLRKPYNPSDIPWKKLEKPANIQRFIAHFRKDLEDSLDPDYVLIDARTGFTEIGGLFTSKLPDIVVLFTGLNEQNRCGTEWVLQLLKENSAQDLMVVFSPVPEGEEDLKKERLEKARRIFEKALPQENRPAFASIPYHPRAALLEEIFVRDWPETMIAEAYRRLKEHLVGLNDDDVETIIIKTHPEMRRLDSEKTLQTLEKHENRFKGIKEFSKILIDCLKWNDRRFYFEGKFKESISFLDRILEIEPKNVEALVNKGAALLKIDRNKEAIATVDRALEIEPKNVGALVNKGVALGELGRYKEAIAMFNRALEIEPKDVNTLYNKGVSLGKLDRHKEEIAAYDRALEIEPKYVEALLNKGVTLGKLGSHKQAITMFDRALEIKPKDVRALDNKGITLSKIGRHADAIKTLMTALKLEPNNPNVLYNLACTNSLSGRSSEAIKYLKRAVILDSKYIRMAADDSDFDSLRSDPRFIELVGPLKRKPFKKKKRSKKASLKRKR
jgi:tetratricopeptide (TPR) repeat protein